MLKISDAHMAAFSAEAREASLARLEQFLLASHPREAAALTGGGLRQFVELGVDRARAYDIDREQDVGVLLSLALRFGEDFAGTPEQGRLQQFLTADVAGPLKIEWIEGHMASAGRGAP